MLEASYGMYLEQKKEDVWWAEKFTRPPENVVVGQSGLQVITQQILQSDYSFKDVYEALKGQLGGISLEWEMEGNEKNEDIKIKTLLAPIIQGMIETSALKRVKGEKLLNFLELQRVKIVYGVGIARCYFGVVFLTQSL